MGYRNRAGAGGFGFIIALVMAGIALFRYFGSQQINATTGEKQHVGITTGQEIALGLQAAPEMEQQYGGPSHDIQGQRLVEEVGNRLLRIPSLQKNPYKFQFHLLADTDTINAFALPGGQIFITTALARKLRTEGQLAGVLGHEVGHVIERHSAQQIAKQQLSQGLTGAAVLATYDPNNPRSQGGAAIATLVANLVNLKYGRNDELQSDREGVKYMAEAGYDPRAMIGVMQVLQESAKGGRTPEFFSTHPNPENRSQRIKEAIQKQFPNGVPDGLKK